LNDKRYAVEIHLVEVDAQGKTVDTLAVKKTEDVTTDLDGLRSGLDFMRDCLGNLMYDHLWDASTLSNRETGEKTYPDSDDDEDDEEEEE
jgi:hypothetical protein